ncbi:hypothetical protein A2U01_0079567, partial [Trifolium medium]|nr:hypothetical protein [Trifolium medium]
MDRSDGTPVFSLGARSPAYYGDGSWFCLPFARDIVAG